MYEDKFELDPWRDEIIPPSNEVLNEIGKDLDFLEQVEDVDHFIGPIREALLHHFDEHALLESVRGPHYDLVEKIEEIGGRSETVPVLFSFKKTDALYNFHYDGLFAITEVDPRNINFRSVRETRENVFISDVNDSVAPVEFRLLTLGGKTYETQYPVEYVPDGKKRTGDGRFFEIPLSRSRKIIGYNDSEMSLTDYTIYNREANRLEPQNATVMVGWEEIDTLLSKSVPGMTIHDSQITLSKLKLFFEKAELMDELKANSKYLSRMLGWSIHFRESTSLPNEDDQVI